eukprot:TRINITY_DN5752_c0_g1_i4.p1 TRINITY_DN5752_c0_g1~~TRINITY_DN5752_c0_g1_i4.p1  ORF type:complete len:366 (+),score=21.45 TRINITY_DN5752_c0_g1_i4:870-1967(+)
MHCSHNPTNCKLFPKVCEITARKNSQFFRDSPKRKQNLETVQLILKEKEVPLEVISDTKTRWNSTLLMIQRTLSLESAMHALKASLDSSMDRNDKEDSKELDGILLNEREIKAASNIASILEPFKYSCDKISLSKFPTASLVYPFIHRLYHIMTTPGTTEFETEKANAAKEIKDKWEDGNSDVMIASFLDPRFKKLTFLDEEKKNEVIAAIKTKCPESLIQAMIVQEEVTDLEEFFGHPRSRSLHAAEKTEFDKYMDEPEEKLTEKFDPLEWWKNKQKPYPNIAKLAEKYLPIPATTVSVERLFRRTGDIVTKKRTSLDPDMVNNLQMLKMVNEQIFSAFLFEIDFNTFCSQGFMQLLQNLVLRN